MSDNELTSNNPNLANPQIDTSSFSYANPIDFSIYNGDEEQVLYISDANQTLILEIKNASPYPIELVVDNVKKKSGSWHAAKDLFHFQLIFRAGTLSSQARQGLTGSGLRQVANSLGWDILFDPDSMDSVDWISFLWLGGKDSKGSDNQNPDEAKFIKNFLQEFNKLNPNYEFTGRLRVSEPNGSNYKILIPNLSADAGGGARGTNIELRYDNIRYPNEEERKTPLSGSRKQFINIINHRGKKVSPFHIGFVDSNTILNDGVTANELTLRITNISNREINFSQKSVSEVSQFTITFDSYDKGFENPNKLQGINIALKNQDDLKNWQPQEPSNQDKELVWAIKYKNPTSLVFGAGDHIDFLLTGIVSSSSSGFSNIYVNYQDISEYWDGQLICQIEKAPLVYRDDKVGIGTDKPSAKLHIKPDALAPLGLQVDGDVNISGSLFMPNKTSNQRLELKENGSLLLSNGESGGQGVILKAETASAYDLTIRNLDNTAYGGIYCERTFIRKKLQVGFDGSTGELEVNGDTAIAGKLSVTNTTFLSGNVGIGGDSSTEKLKVYGDTAIAGKLSVTNTTFLSGNVGIGIQNPEVGLHLRKVNFRIDDGAIQSWGPITLDPDIDNNSRDKQVNINGSIYAGNSDIYFTKTDHDHTRIGNEPGHAAIENDGSGYKALMILGRMVDQRRIIRLYDDVTICGNLAIDGNINGQKFPPPSLVNPWPSFGVSDIVLKSKVSQFTFALSKLDKLNPVSFYWKDINYFLKKEDNNIPDTAFLSENEILVNDPEEEKYKAELEKQQFGFIAQELEQVFPDWVTTGDDGYKRINLSMLPPFVVQAIKELKQKYDDLAIKYQSLEKRLEDLENKVT